MSGNSNTCAQTVIVADDQSPSVTCPADVSVSADPGQCFASGVNLGSPATSDNCAVASVTNDAPAQFPVGSNTVTWTVTDLSGNTNSCQQTVVVLDPIAPTAVCTNITVNLDAGGVVAVSAGQVDGGSTDNCAITSRLIDGALTNVFTCAALGTTNVTLTVSDASGNTDSCVAAITVLDVTPPTAVGSNLTVNLGSGGTVTVAGSQIDGGSTDNCGIASRLIDGAATKTFTCADLGPNAVTLTVADASGNTNTCAATVTVQDVALPTITCPANVSVNADAGQCFASGVTLGSPVTADNCAVATVTNDAPAQFPVGTNTVNWTVTDTSANTAACQQQVVVADNQPPALSCPANVTVNADAGLCTASGVNLGSPTTSDNCGITTVGSNAPASFPVGTNTVTWTVTDVHANTAACQQQVIVVDNQPPCHHLPRRRDRRGEFHQRSRRHLLVADSVGQLSRCRGRVGAAVRFALPRGHEHGHLHRHRRLRPCDGLHVHRDGNPQRVRSPSSGRQDWQLYLV